MSTLRKSQNIGRETPKVERNEKPAIHPAARAQADHAKKQQEIRHAAAVTNPLARGISTRTNSAPGKATGKAY